MTQRPLPRFWSALDEVPGATAAKWDWRLRLEDDWPIGSAFLKPVGQLAREISCPYPGGDGCPRKVVQHREDRFRAVCGLAPSECDAIEISRDEITCLTLDRRKLVTLVGTVFNTEQTGGQAASDDGEVCVGMHHVAAGVGFPVLLLIPGPFGVGAEVKIPGSDAGVVAIIVPTRRSASRGHLAELQSKGAVVFFLEEVVTIRDGRLVGAVAAEKLLASLRNRLLEDHAPRPTVRAWVLPPDARWEELVFSFSEAQLLTVRFRGEVRTFSPAALGMNRERAGKPTIQWTTLQTFAEVDGALSWKDPKANVRVKKQKQLLSQKLTNAFGLPGDPIVWNPRTRVYRTRFRISGTPLGFRHARETRR